MPFCRVEALVGKNIVAAAAGSAHTVVSTDAGEVLTFGDGRGGGLGHGAEDEELLPCAVHMEHLLGPP